MKLKIIIFLIILILTGNILKIFIADNLKIKVDINETELILKQKSDAKIHKINVNEAEYEDLITIGFSKSQAEKISIYKDFTGDIFFIEELYRVNGFGKAAMERAEKFLYISEKNKKRKKHNINKLNEIELRMTGFTKKEIKKLVPLMKGKKIRTNIEIINLIGIDRYAEIEDRIKYND